MKQKLKDTTALLQSIQKGLALEATQTADMLKTYKKILLKHDVSDEEISEASKQLKDLFRTSCLSVLVILPGSVITVPFLINFFRKYNIELLPDSFVNVSNDKDNNGRE